MPRDGLSQYAPPPGTNGITNYTIESTKYNGFVADVTQDLNLPRPIVAGGTGANNARDAMTSLQGDVAYQVVTNYDAYAFVSGSFYSAAGATSAPTGNAFIGQCYTSDPAVVPPAVPSGQNMFIEARDVTTGLKYLRQKTAGVWGAWAQQAGGTAALDAAYVNVAGDTMTGSLTFNTATGIAVILNKTATAPLSLYGMMNSLARWSIDLGDGSAESTGNAGSNFYVRRYSDAGAQLGLPISIARAADTVTFGADIITTGPVRANGALWTMSTATTGTLQFGNTGTKNLAYDGTNYTLTGGNLTVMGDVISYRSGAPTTGFHYFGNSGTKSLACDGTNFNFSGGGLGVTNVNAFIGIYATSGVPALNFYIAGTHQSFINDNGSAIIVNSSSTGANGMYILHGGGSWTTLSDARLPYKQTARPLTVLDKIDGVQLYENIVNDRPDLFVKAQEFQKAFPHLVYEGTGPDAKSVDYVPTGMGDPNVWGMSYERAGVVALQGLKELKQLVTELRAEIASLKAAR